MATIYKICDREEWDAREPAADEGDQLPEGNDH